MSNIEIRNLTRAQKISRLLCLTKGQVTTGHLPDNSSVSLVRINNRKAQKLFPEFILICEAPGEVLAVHYIDCEGRLVLAEGSSQRDADMLLEELEKAVMN